MDWFMGFVVISSIIAGAIAFIVGSIITIWGMFKDK